MGYRVALDIGGTFTDLVVVEGGERTYPGKVPSTPSSRAEGVVAGLEAFVPRLSEIDFLVHGTTVGLNAFLERKGTRVLLLTTEGLRDAYTIARHDRKELYALQYRKPERLVPRRDVLEVRERLRFDGTVEIPLDVGSLEPAIRRIESEGINAVAVCLVHAYTNPVHELAVREALYQAFPGLSVTLSHEIAREWREYERASSAVLNAYIAPRVEGYLEMLEAELDARRVRSTLYVMQSNGGITTARRARRAPIQTLLSGPVGGTIGGAALSRASGRPNLLCVDMGGTSFDLSLIVDGAPGVSSETELEGLPVLLSLVDIHTIGAGGGSLAWLEAGGLRVGPKSAGAEPGPACYGRGGTEPTVTDANLHLGRLDPSSFLGGRVRLDADASEAALRSLGSRLSLTETALAEGVLQIVNAKMADAMRTITVKQGIDPRDFTLVAFGGAGPMHAAWLAAELEIAETIVPWSPGTFSAWGMLQTDMRHDVVRSFFHPLAEVDAGELGVVLGELEAEGSALLAEEGIPDGDRYATRSADMRYVGQEYTVPVAVPARLDLANLDAAFHDAHATRYGHATPGAPVELVNLRLAAMGRVGAGPTPFTSPGDDAGALVGRRAVVFAGDEHETPIFRREHLPTGWSHEGAAILVELSATTVVPPDFVTRVDEWGNLVVGRSG